MSTASARLRASVAVILAAILSGLCVLRTAESAFDVVESAEAYKYVSAWRDIAGLFPFERIALLCGDHDEISPVERSRLIALSWEHGRLPPHAVDVNGLAEGMDDCVITALNVARTDCAALADAGFSPCVSNDFALAWHHGDCKTEQCYQLRIRPAAIREAGSLLLIFLLLLACWRCVADDSAGHCWRWTGVCAMALFIFLGALSVLHPLTAPNGLGTYGGKAKLIFESGCVPVDFLKAPEYSFLQPAYPPGFTLLALAHFVLSGAVGDRLVQLLLPATIVIVFLEMTKRCIGWRPVLPIMMYLCLPVVLGLVTGFYAEPFAALALLTGWNTMQSRRCLRGALAMGCAALFRPEGIFVAGAFFCGLALQFHCRRAAWKMAIAVLAPGAAWWMLCLLGGGGIQGFDFSRLPNVALMFKATLCEAKFVAFNVLPVVCIVLLTRKSAGALAGRSLFAAAWPFAALLILIPFACGLHSSPYGRWMVESTVPRLVWWTSIVPICEFIKIAYNEDLASIAITPVHKPAIPILWYNSRRE